MKWYVSGDTHGNFTRFTNMNEYKTDKHVAVIVLGDCAVNWTLKPEHDSGLKRQLIKKFSNFEWFLLRGNHDARPEHVPTMEKVWNDDVTGMVYQERKYPNIHYFIDGETYHINGYRVLTIGGAYSVDKDYRIARGAIWYPNEQLNGTERVKIKNLVKGEHFDFVLTHTAPISWEPRDVFLPGLDQSSVDKTMELWLDKIRQSIHYKIWLFGHFHRDRLERPGVQMMYQDIEELDHIYARWTDPQVLEEEWYLPKAPMYYAKDE